MKQSLLSSCVFFLLFSFSVQGQEIATLWFDSNWHPSEEEIAVYYRPVPVKKENGFLWVDYYISGVKQMEGVSKSVTEEIFDGEVVWYHENGITAQKVYFSNGELDGLRQIFHENGVLKNERMYVSGSIESLWVEYYDNGQLFEKGNYKDNEREGDWKTYYKDGRLQSEGVYSKGKKVGTWESYFYTGIEEEEL